MLRCFPVHVPIAWLRNITCMCSNHIPSFNSSCSYLTHHFFQYTFLSCIHNMFLIFCWNFFKSTWICPARCRVCQHDPRMSKSWVSHYTASAVPFTWFHQCTSLTCLSKLFLGRHISFRPRSSLSKKTVVIVDICSSTSKPLPSMDNDKDIDCFFPAASVMFLLSSSISRRDAERLSTPSPSRQLSHLQDFPRVLCH